VGKGRRIRKREELWGKGRRIRKREELWGKGRSVGKWTKRKDWKE